MEFETFSMKETQDDLQQQLPTSGELIDKVTLKAVIEGYLYPGEVEALSIPHLLEIIDEQPTIKPEAEAMKRILAKLEQKASLCSLRDRGCIFAVRLDRVIKIVKAELEKEEP